MKVKLSRVQWESVGARAGWLKVAQAVSYKSKNFGISFVEGNSFRNRDGSTVKIVKVYPEDEIMEIQHENGELEKIDMETLDPVSGDIELHKQEKFENQEQARVDKRNRNVERRRRRKWQEMGEKPVDIHQGDDAFAIGYLAKNGTLKIQIPSHDSRDFDYLPPFLEKYRVISGEQLNADDPNFVVSDKYTAEGRIAKWKEELFISAPNVTPEIKAKIITTLKLSQGAKGGSNFYGTPIIWSLIQIGFRAGSNVANIPKIRESIPEQFKADFDAGVAAV